MNPLCDQYRINEINLAERKRLIGLTASTVAILRRLSGWAKRVGPALVRDFYDLQFATEASRVFFENYGKAHGRTLAEQRVRLERTQLQYFLDIFAEADAGGQFGLDYYEKRLRIGSRHNLINLPQKWYIGSYAGYQQLVRKYLGRAYLLRPGFRAQAEHAIFTIFNYDLQAVGDAFFYDYLASIGLDLSRIAVTNPKFDLSEHYAELKDTVLGVIRGTIQTSRQLTASSQTLADASTHAGQVSRDIAATINQVAQGNTQQSASITRTASSMEQMRRAIEGIAQGAQVQSETTGQTAAALSKLSAAVEDIRRSAQEQSSGMQRAGAARISLGGALQQVDTATSQVATQTDEAAHSAAQGAKVAGQSLEAMERVREITNELAGRVHEMGQRTGQVGAIVSTIDDIAGQTNLLALNASIEAARAGKEGQGFAVVAKEVGKLAERSASATREITQMIDMVKAAADEVVASMQQTGAQVAAAVQLVNQAADAFATITTGTRASAEQAQGIREGVQAMVAADAELANVVTAVADLAERSRENAEVIGSQTNQVVASLDRVSSVVEQNSAATEEMAASSTEVTQAIDSIAAVSEENSAAAEQVSAGAEEMTTQITSVSQSAHALADIASHLHSLLGQFNIEVTGDDGPAAPAVASVPAARAARPVSPAPSRPLPAAPAPRRPAAPAASYAPVPVGGNGHGNGHARPNGNGNGNGHSHAPVAAAVAAPARPAGKTRAAEGAKLAWDASMATGDATIDQQHQELIRQINKLVDAMSQGRGKQEIEPILGFLGDYVQKHFGYEEGCMERHHCPVAEVNKRAHGRLIEAFQSIRDRYEREGASLDLVLQIRQELGDWLVNHIRKIDTGLRPCIH